MPEDKSKLYEKFNSLNKLLQEVNNILGPEESELDKDPKLKLKIPSGYIRTTNDFRERLSCIKDLNLQSNIAYQLQLSDLFSWILTRTKVSFSVREMLIKYEIVLMASISESLVTIFTAKNKSFENKLISLLDKNKIDKEIMDENKWLWNTRLAIHPYKLDHREFNKYTDDDFNRAVFAVNKLLIALNKC